MVYPLWDSVLFYRANDLILSLLKSKPYGSLKHAVMVLLNQTYILCITPPKSDIEKSVFFRHAVTYCKSIAS